MMVADRHSGPVMAHPSRDLLHVRLDDGLASPYGQVAKVLVSCRGAKAGPGLVA